jgi:hypothetical protein
MENPAGLSNSKLMGILPKGTLLVILGRFNRSRQKDEGS